MAQLKAKLEGAVEFSFMEGRETYSLTPFNIRSEEPKYQKCVSHPGCRFCVTS